MFPRNMAGGFASQEVAGWTHQKVDQSTLCRSFTLCRDYAKVTVK